MKTLSEQYEDLLRNHEESSMPAELVFAWSKLAAKIFAVVNVGSEYEVTISLQPRPEDYKRGFVCISLYDRNGCYHDTITSGYFETLTQAIAEINEQIDKRMEAKAPSVIEVGGKKYKLMEE